jgi:hypothetical protein
MISDLSKMLQAIDAVTDHASVKDVAALEHDLGELTAEQRLALGRELVESGAATLRTNGQSFRLQIKHRPLRPI